MSLTKVEIIPIFTGSNCVVSLGALFGGGPAEGEAAEVPSPAARFVAIFTVTASPARNKVECGDLIRPFGLHEAPRRSRVCPLGGVH